MKFNGYDVALITDEKERLYYLGFHSTAGYVVVTKKGKTFVVDNRYYSAAKRVLGKKGIAVVCGSGYETFTKIAVGERAKTVGIDFTKTTLSEYESLKKLGFSYVDASEEMRLEMSVKTETEIKYLASSCSM